MPRARRQRDPETGNGDRDHPRPLTYEAGGAGGVDAVAAIGTVAVGDLRDVRVGARRAHVRILKLPLEAGARDRIHLAAVRMESRWAARGGCFATSFPEPAPGAAGGLTAYLQTRREAVTAFWIS